MIDELDRRIITILSEDSRTSFREIASRVGLSAPAVVERVARLHDTGAIAGFTIKLGRVAVGLRIQVLMRTAAEAGGGPRLLDAIKGSPEVEECHKITGADSYILKASLASMEALEQLIERFERVGTVNTSLILSSPITSRQPSIPTAPSRVVGPAAKLKTHGRTSHSHAVIDSVAPDD